MRAKNSDIRTFFPYLGQEFVVCSLLGVLALLLVGHLHVVEAVERPDAQKLNTQNSTKSQHESKRQNLLLPFQLDSTSYGFSSSPNSAPPAAAAATTTTPRGGLTADATSLHFPPKRRNSETYPPTNSSKNPPTRKKRAGGTGFTAANGGRAGRRAERAGESRGARGTV